MLAIQYLWVQGKPEECCYSVQCSHDPVVAMAVVPMVLSMLLCSSLIEVSDLLLMRS